MFKASRFSEGANDVWTGRLRERPAREAGRGAHAADRAKKDELQVSQLRARTRSRSRSAAPATRSRPKPKPPSNIRNVTNVADVFRGLGALADVAVPSVWHDRLRKRQRVEPEHSAAPAGHSRACSPPAKRVRGVPRAHHFESFEFRRNAGAVTVAVARPARGAQPPAARAPHAAAAFRRVVIKLLVRERVAAIHERAAALCRARARNAHKLRRLARLAVAAAERMASARFAFRGFGQHLVRLRRADLVRKCFDAQRNAHARKAALELLRAVEAETRERNRVRLQTVSVTLQPYEFMIRGSGFCTELPLGHRGVRFVRDSEGRYHQQLSEITVEVPLALISMLPGLYWNHEHSNVVDSPRINWNWPLLGAPLVQDALGVFHSPLSALGVVDVIEIPLAKPFDALAVQNFDSAHAGHLFHAHTSARTAASLRLEPSELAQASGRPAPQNTLDAWLMPVYFSGAPADTSGMSGRQDLASSNACGYDILLHLFKQPLEALQKPRGKRRQQDHKGGRYKDLQMTLKGLWAFFHGQKDFDPALLGLTLPEFRTFFVHLGLQLTVLDIAGQPISDACYEPVSANKKISPRHVWVVHHNNHLYLLTHGLDSLKIKAATLQPALAAALQTRLQPLGDHDGVQVPALTAHCYVPHAEPIFVDAGHSGDDDADTNDDTVAGVEAKNTNVEADADLMNSSTEAEVRIAAPTGSGSGDTPAVSTKLAPGARPEVFVGDLDGLARINLGAFKRKYLRVICPVDMVAALRQLLVQCHYEPAVIMRGHKIVALKLRVDGVEITLAPPDAAPMDRTVMLQTPAEHTLYCSLERRLVHALMRPETLSSYHPDVAAAFRTMARAPLVYGTGYCGPGLFEPELVAAHGLITGACASSASIPSAGLGAAAFPGVAPATSEHDISKAHTAALLGMKSIPVFGVFDSFGPFVATDPVQDHCLYVVRRPAELSTGSAEHLLLDADVNLVTGATLKLCSGWPGVVVESVLRPSKLIETSEVSEALKAIWASSLALGHKKFLPNKAVGLAGRRYNTSESTLLFRDAAEARHFKEQFIGMGSQLVARTVGDEVLYFVHHCYKAELVDGFLSCAALGVRLGSPCPVSARL